MELTQTRLADLTHEANCLPPTLKDFTETELGIYKSKIGAKVKDLPIHKLNEEASQIWFYIKLKWGLKSNNESEERASVASIQNDLMSKPMLTVNEVIKCLNFAMDGQYGENAFFNSAKFRGWLQKYYDESRIIAGRVQLAIDAQNEKPKPVPTEEKQKADIIVIANKHIEQMKAANESQMNFTWFGGLNHLFDIAWKFQLIPFAEERRLQVLAQCNNDRDLAKSELYKLWISEMAEAEMILNENGEMI